MACHDGLSGKEIADKYSVAPNMVIQQACHRRVPAGWLERRACCRKMRHSV